MKKYFVSLILLSVFTVNAQKPLNVGDTLANYSFQTLFNHPLPTFSLRDYKNKTVLINFMKWGCSHNYDVLPFLFYYQHKYNKELAVIIVSDEMDATMNSMFESRRGLKELKLPLARKDTSFANLFPHATTPHMVIIGKDRQIKAIIQDQQLNDSVLQLVMKGKIIDHLPPQITKPQPPGQSFISGGILNKNNLLYNSILSKYLPGIEPLVEIKKMDSNRLRLYMSNLNIKEMYTIAWEPLIRLNELEHDLRIIWKVSDPLKYVGRRGTPGDEDKLFCYESIIPHSPLARNNAEALAYMRADLNRYFNLEAAVEKRKMTCYVITPLNSHAVVVDKVSAKNSYVQQWVDDIEVHNLSFNIAAMALKPYLFMDKPLIIEGEDNRLFNFKVKRKYKDFQSLALDLFEKGLKLTIEDREIDCLVIKEKGK